MKPIYYKSIEGTIINLIATPYRMLTETELLNSAWEWETQGINFPKMSALKKSLISPPFKIRVTGSTKDEMMNNLEYIDSVFDRDCFLFNETKQMGRLYIGDFYRECLITSSGKGKVFEKKYTTVEYVATSNNGYWKNDKTVTFSGTGTLTGEIAESVLFSTTYRPDKAIAEPLANKKLHVESVGSPPPSSNNRTHTQTFDLGQVTDIESFSGLYFRHTAGGTPVGANIQTWDGESTTDTQRTQSVTAIEHSSKIFVDSFTHITIDSYDRSSEGAGLVLYGYDSNENEMYSQRVYVDDTIDVSDYDYITFYYGWSSGATATVTYTVDLQDWSTIDSIYIDYNVTDDIECVVENETFRMIRFRCQSSATLPNLDDDLSIISAEVVPDRNLLDLGYSAENVSYRKTSAPPYTNLSVFTLDDGLYEGYMTFDDTSIILKHIGCSKVVVGNVTVQGYSSGAWTDILELETNDENISQDYDTHYDKIRLKIHRNPVTATASINNFTIEVQTDARVYNESYAPSEAIIEIKGAWNSPTIEINNVQYGANIELDEGHTLVIDTKNKTVRDYSDDVTYDNVYSSRLEDSFTPIEVGEQQVEWVGSATEIKVTLEQARSMPKWN